MAAAMSQALVTDRAAPICWAMGGFGLHRLRRRSVKDTSEATKDPKDSNDS